MLGSLIGGARGATRARGRKWMGALAATALVSTVLVVAANPSGAATTTKSLTATCTGADAATSGALSAFGGSVAAPVSVTTEAPPFVEPGQTGIPVTMKWALSLDAATVNLVAAISPSLVVSNTVVDATVSGPTSTTVIEGRPAGQTINLVPNQPFSAEFPPFTGELNDIGGSGIIKVSTQNIAFSIQLTSGPLTDPLNLKCTTGATLASIPVKVAGSPNIVQPIDLEVGAGEEVTVDVLADYVTAGTTKDGKVKPVESSTLKVVDGPGTIVDGKLVATAPGPGSSADVTFEVCAAPEVIPGEAGATEVQELRIFEDVPNIAGKRQLGARFNFAGEAADDVLWSAAPLIGLPGAAWKPSPDLSSKVNDDSSWWLDNVNTFALLQSRFRAPSAAEVQAALETIPTIGPGNVTVTKGARKNAGDPTQPGLAYHPYTVEFSGALANRAVDQIGTAKLYSFFPQEIKSGLLALAGGAGGGGGAPTAPIPPGKTALEYVNELNNQAGYYLSIGKLLDGADGSPGYVSTVELLLTVIGENIGSLIDVQAATALLNRLFQPTPEVVTIAQGEDPTEDQTQELCSQGLVTLSTPGEDEPPTSAPPPGDGTGGDGSGGSGSGTGGSGTGSGTGSGSGTTGGAKLAFTG